MISILKNAFHNSSAKIRLRILPCLYPVNFLALSLILLTACNIYGKTDFSIGVLPVRVMAATNIDQSKEQNRTLRQQRGSQKSQEQESPTAEETIKGYADFLSKKQNKNGDSESSTHKEEQAEDIRFTLIYLDNDDIPELAVTESGPTMDPVTLYYYKNGKVQRIGSYSMYGQMYYSPKTGIFMPMYFFSPANGELLKYQEGRTVPYLSWEADDDGGFFLNKNPVSKETFMKETEKWMGSALLPVFEDENSVQKDQDLEKTLFSMAESAPIGITKSGIPAIDDSYLSNGKLLIKGLHAGKIPGIWYLESDEPSVVAYYEFDTNGTFTAHDSEGGVITNGTLEYRGRDPILIYGGIYDLYLFDGTEYNTFGIAPETKGNGYYMTFSGTVYRKYQ